MLIWPGLVRGLFNIAPLRRAVITRVVSVPVMQPKLRKALEAVDADWARNLDVNSLASARQKRSELQDVSSLKGFPNINHLISSKM